MILKSGFFRLNSNVSSGMPRSKRRKMPILSCLCARFCAFFSNKKRLNLLSNGAKKSAVAKIMREFITVMKFL